MQSCSELQFPNLNNATIMSAKFSAQSMTHGELLSKTGECSLLPRLPRDPSYPSPSQLRLPHCMQQGLPSPPTSVLPSCLCTNRQLFLACHPALAFQPTQSPWEVLVRSPGRGLSQRPPAPLSESIPLCIVAPGYGSVSFLSRLGAPLAHEPCLSHPCSLTTCIRPDVGKVG